MCGHSEIFILKLNKTKSFSEPQGTCVANKDNGQMGLKILSIHYKMKLFLFLDIPDLELIMCAKHYIVYGLRYIWIL